MRTSHSSKSAGTSRPKPQTGLVPYPCALQILARLHTGTVLPTASLQGLQPVCQRKGDSAVDVSAVTGQQTGAPDWPLCACSALAW